MPGPLLGGLASVGCTVPYSPSFLLDLAVPVTARSIFGHAMNGETQRYTVADYAADMRLSQMVGIDAWALNVAWYPGEPEQLEKIFAAAEEMRYPVFFSFDMLHWNKANASNVMLHDRLARWATHEQYYRLDGKIVISTFNGAEKGTFLDGVSTFRESSDRWNALFASVRSQLNLEVYYAPCWLAPSPVSSVDARDLEMDAVFNWFAWGGVGESVNVTADADGRSRYQELIELGDRAPDHIEFVTLTDWGESTYFMPVRDTSDPPAGTIDTASYVSGHNHTAFLLLSAYYNEWYKTGVEPTVTSEVVFWYHRKTPIDGLPTDDPIGRSDSCKALSDTIYAVVLIPEGSKADKLFIATGGVFDDGHGVGPGVNLVSTPFVVGNTGISLRDAAGDQLLGNYGVPIVRNTEIADYNYFSYVVPVDAVPSTFMSVNGGATDAKAGGGSRAVATALITLIARERELECERHKQRRQFRLQ
ncbi:hypothetical protein Rhopal_001500-T1 [Rhodotorula paludigena]|uniref:Uncharacterized protein n=1 Tax=Rhodotorula paludigena TaxID=86838 RepID=A0AAV5GGZ6_9BASI|nr:hypothetical protein Rhopal_001500-T1 [Rhodotorula paludigena]